MRLKENKDVELVRSSVPIAGENDGYVDAKPEIEDCSNGFAPQPNTTADGSQKMIVPVVISMTSYLFSHYRLQMYTYLNRSLRNGMLRRIVGFSFTNRIQRTISTSCLNGCRHRQVLIGMPLMLPCRRCRYGTEEKRSIFDHPGLF